MPPVRTTPRDVLIRVPKVEPYSNSYLSPSARAKEEAKKLAAAAATADGSANAATATAAEVSATDASTASTSNARAAPMPSASSGADAAAVASTSAASADATTAQASKPDAGGQDAQDRRQRGNSPTLPFLDVDRHEDQTVELSKAATSSAGWNSLLVWARRQRGAQWDASTALWQVDKYSREYYSFAEHPATTDRSKQPGAEGEDDEKDGDDKALQAVAVGEDDDDKGPTRVSSRNKSVDDAGGASPPPVALGRSVRLLRR
ncbi:uncharacterized protein SRS1_13033 [Sporisorium reilianum f. sp. reilianum]|uniref:Uncharacterized protein n=1 Tax=Sporisorium reilianum f. sp. reilianum TaxID=72559 RepID=A0A2N8UAZ3_9BASI|nr:uncharacterized protein SRS1_13033 [Sporisorium reilianum f. sp. reilianum]